VYRSCTLLVAKASGRQVLPGVDTPFLDEALCCCVVPVSLLCLLLFRWALCCFSCFRVHELAYLHFCSLCLFSASLSIATAFVETRYASLPLGMSCDMSSSLRGLRGLATTHPYSAAPPVSSVLCPSYLFLTLTVARMPPTGTDAPLASNPSNSCP
jgi:hypothetical protein